MNYIKYILTILKIFLKAKWVFNLPKKKKYLIVDGIYNPFCKYIKKNETSLLYRRGEEINFIILIRCLLSFKLSTLEYFCEYIRHVSPQLILTAFDYHTIFYKISKKTNIKTIMLQKGSRGYQEPFFTKTDFFFPKHSKKKFFVDYIFVYNDTVKNFYKKKIDGKIFTTGSFENNFSKSLPLFKKKNEVVFISNFSPSNKDKSENEDIIARELYKLCNQSKLKFNILPRYRKYPEYLKKEIKFYQKTINKNISFILHQSATSYNLLLKFQYIFATQSTLAEEFLAKGYKVGFITYKSKNNSMMQYRFGNFGNLPENGLFWLNLKKLDTYKIKKIFNFITKSKYKDWYLKTNYYTKKVMNFDYQNKTFQSVLKSVNSKR